MDFIRNWALTIALCSMGTALIYFLVPKGGLEKSMRTAISIFLLSVIISPIFKIQGLNLSDINWDGEALSEKLGEQSEYIQEAAREQFQKIVESSLLKVLDENNFGDIDIQVKVVSNEQGHISILEIRVLSALESLEIRKQISEIIEQETGLEPIFN